MRNRIKAREMAAMIGMLTLIGVVIYLMCVYADMSSVTTAVNMFVALMGLIFSSILYLCCIFGSFRTEVKQKRFFGLLIIVTYLCFFTDSVIFTYEFHPEKKTQLFYSYTVLYLLTAVYWHIFHLYLEEKYARTKSEKRLYPVFYVISASYILLTLANMFFPILFTVDDRCSLARESIAIDALAVAFFLVFTANVIISNNDLKTKLTLLSYALFPLGANVIMVLFWDNAFLRAVSDSIYTVLYLIPLYLIFFNIYVESDRALLERSAELAESKANALALRINPHFIANTLGSIAALCSTSPKEAEKLTKKFARYLRDNYADGDGDVMIPFEEELEQLKNYLSIEQVRFPLLKTKYDIHISDFVLPPLIVQPLVENAVRHGIHKKKNGAGTVVIASHETADSYVITISDDGVGFAKLPEDGEKHLGIQNSRNRLAILCGGTLTVESEPGKGTVSKIEIPKERKEKS